jgi:hypothetical protein
LAYDEVHDELTIANAVAQAILTFRGGADGKEAPIRIIQGPHTTLESPEFGLTVDPVNDEIYILEHDFISVFSRTANGDAAPIRVIRGPNTHLSNPYGYIGLRGVGVDWVHNVLVVGGYYKDAGHVLIFDRTASGDAKPRAVIAGPKSGLRGVSYTMRVHPAKGWILLPTSDGIGVWSVNDSGDIPPLYLLRSTRRAGPNLRGGGEEGGGGGMGGHFTFSPKAKELYSYSDNAVSAYSFPEIF